MVILANETCGICRKCFVQKLWQHLLIISAFFASWWSSELSMYKRDNDGLFSTRVLCRSSNSSCTSTDLSLVAVNCQLSLLAFCWASYRHCSCNHVVLVCVAWLLRIIAHIRTRAHAFVLVLVACIYIRTLHNTSSSSHNCANPVFVHVLCTV